METGSRAIAPPTLVLSDAVLVEDAADVTVAATLREAWRRAASFNAREQTAGRWLAGLARKAARDQLRRRAMSSAYA